MIKLHLYVLNSGKNKIKEKRKISFSLENEHFRVFREGTLYHLVNWCIIFVGISPWHGMVFIFLLSFQAFIDSRKLQNRTAKTLWKGRSFWFVCNKEILSKQAKLHQHRVLSGFACTLAFNCKFLRFLVPRWCTNKRFDDFFVRFKTQFLAYIFGLKWFCVHACLQLQVFEVFSAALMHK